MWERIEDDAFFVLRTMIKVGGSVSHKTKIQDGKHSQWLYIHTVKRILVKVAQSIRVRYPFPRMIDIFPAPE